MFLDLLSVLKSVGDDIKCITSQVAKVCT